MPTRPTSAAGYSGTPLPAKLGLEPGLRVVLLDAPASVESSLAAALAPATRLARLSTFDFALAFVGSRAALTNVLDRLAPKLDDAGMVWIAWPKKASGVATDMTEDAVRGDALPRGLVDVKVCAIDATWSGLKLVRRRELRRPSGGRAMRKTGARTAP